MEAFLAASSGTWLNRRSIHHLDHQDDEAADSNLVIEPFDNSDPVVEKLPSFAIHLTLPEAVDFGGKVTQKRCPQR